MLFVSKDTLKQQVILSKFSTDHFGYIIVNEVHHGQSSTYLNILEYFKPEFILGKMAIPNRLGKRDIFNLLTTIRPIKIPDHKIIGQCF
ncbi:MAG: hypothetical protein M2R45_02969 [Verrucomicrobia subdivision 3 bacterium]|nr:hypothetical protein [Limisphaerales bacterium]MCS1415311.1 hypothetical protein [Limisphaerales bacterium]